MSNSTKASNSSLFKQAHKMTKLTIQPNETYRYKFGQWLIFLKNGITNTLGFTSINQSVCYVPILEHDKADKIVFETPFKVSKVTTNKHGKYIQTLNIDTMIISFMLALLDSKLFISIIIIIQFMLVLKFI